MYIIKSFLKISWQSVCNFTVSSPFFMLDDSSIKWEEDKGLSVYVRFCLIYKGGNKRNYHKGKVIVCQHLCPFIKMQFTAVFTV